MVGGNKYIGPTIKSDKTCVLCPLNYNIVNADLPDIFWNGQTFERKDGMEYLEISFDRSLSFKYHSDHILQKTKL